MNDDLTAMVPSQVRTIRTAFNQVISELGQMGMSSYTTPARKDDLRQEADRLRDLRDRTCEPPVSGIDTTKPVNWVVHESHVVTWDDLSEMALMMAQTLAKVGKDLIPEGAVVSVSSTPSTITCRKMVAKRYVPQLQLEADQFAVERNKKDLSAVKTQLDVLERFTRAKMLKTLESDIVTAKAKWESEKASHGLEENKLKEIDEQPTVMRKLIQAYTDEAGQVVVDPAIITAQHGPADQGTKRIGEHCLGLESRMGSTAPKYGTPQNNADVLDGSTA